MRMSVAKDLAVQTIGGNFIPPRHIDATVRVGLDEETRAIFPRYQAFRHVVQRKRYRVETTKINVPALKDVVIEVNFELN